MTSSKPPLSSPPLPHIFSLNHHHRLGHGHSINIAAASSSDQQQQPTTCSRWNPTAEQLLALEELYRRGIRSPTAAQIQQIATRLRRFGKIEGKNVFYWFQNHKARERQKRRRLADNARPFADQDQPSDTNTSGKLPENQHAPVLRREGYKVEQKKSRVRALNCSKRSEASNVSPGNSNSSIEPDAGVKIKRNATWQAVELPSSPSHSMMTTTTTVSIYRTRPQDFNEDLTNNLGDDQETVAGETLELFPLKGGVNGEAINVRKQDTERVGSLSAPNHQYIEFLPLKN